MGQKYTRYIEQGRQTFADPWTCSEMCRLQILHALPGELARLPFAPLSQAEGGGR